MGAKQMKIKLFLVGATSFLASIVVANPAIALPSANLESYQLLSQRDKALTSVQGTIKTIAGDVVTLEMPNGKTQRVIINQSDLTRLNLRPGMQVAMMLNDQNMATQVTMVQANTNYTTQPLRGTIRSIARDVITLETVDGVQNVRIAATEISRLNLQPGMQIALMLDQNNVARSVSVVESSTTRVGTTNQQVIQRTVQTTSVAPVTNQSTVTRTTQVTQTTQTQPQNTMRPVRALW